MRLMGFWGEWSLHAPPGDFTSCGMSLRPRASVLSTKPDQLGPGLPSSRHQGRGHISVKASESLGHWAGCWSWWGMCTLEGGEQGVSLLPSACSCGHGPVAAEGPFRFRLWLSIPRRDGDEEKELESSCRERKDGHRGRSVQREAEGGSLRDKRKQCRCRQASGTGGQQDPCLSRQEAPGNTEVDITQGSG